MRIVRLTEPCRPGDVIRLHHITDVHAGAPDFDEDAFLERRALIEEDPDARWIMGGDGGELIKHNDKRYDHSSIEPRYRLATDLRQATKEHLLELFEPIKEKCWGWADGNHERAVDVRDGGNFGVEVACALGLEDRFVGYRGFVHITLNVTKTLRMAQLIDIQHGWQAGRSKGAFLNQAEKELSFTAADIVLRGHSHIPNGRTFAQMDVNTTVSGVVVRPRTVINGGSWRRGFRDNLAGVRPDRLSEFERDLWHETKGFAAEPVGGPVLILRPNPGGGRGRTRLRVSPAHVEHTLIQGRIDRDVLGM